MRRSDLERQREALANLNALMQNTRDLEAQALECAIEDIEFGRDLGPALVIDPRARHGVRFEPSWVLYSATIWDERHGLRTFDSVESLRAAYGRR